MWYCGPRGASGTKVAPTFCVHIFIQTSDELWFAVAVWNVLEQDTVAALDLHDYERAEVVPLSLLNSLLPPSLGSFRGVEMTQDRASSCWRPYTV